LSCRWAPLERVWPRPPDTHPTDIYKHLLGPQWNSRHRRPCNKQT